MSKGKGMRLEKSKGKFCKRWKNKGEWKAKSLTNRKAPRLQLKNLVLDQD